MEHFYINIKDYKLFDEIKQLENFQPFYLYYLEERKMGFQHEIGRLRYDNFHVHILLGNMPNSGCPWCGAPGEMKKIYSSYLYDQYQIVCINCGARGPTLKVIPEMGINPDTNALIEERMQHQFKNTRTWEVDFKNPYDESTNLT